MEDEPLPVGAQLAALGVAIAHVMITQDAILGYLASLRNEPPPPSSAERLNRLVALVGEKANPDVADALAAIAEMAALDPAP